MKSPFECVTLAHLPEMRLLLYGTRIRKALQLCKLLPQLGPYDPSDPLVSVVDRDAVWNLMQAPIGDSQDRPLGFYSKALPSTADNYSPFKKQLLVCYWDSAKTQCLITGYQVTT